MVIEKTTVRIVTKTGRHHKNLAADVYLTGENNQPITRIFGVLAVVHHNARPCHIGQRSNCTQFVRAAMVLNGLGDATGPDFKRQAGFLIHKNTYDMLFRIRHGVLAHLAHIDALPLHTADFVPCQQYRHTQTAACLPLNA